VAGAVTLRLGGSLRQVAGETREDFRFVAAAPTRRRKAGGRAITAGLFGSAEWRRAGWHAALDLAADRWRLGRGQLRESDLAGATLLELAAPPRARWEGSGRLALGRSLGPRVELRAAGYRGWRLPTLNELYRPFRAAADAVAPNPALDPERLVGIEAGIDWRPSTAATLSGSVFANRLRGAIANVTLGQGPGLFPIVGFVAAGGAYRARRNLPAIASRGIEIDAGWSRGAWRGDLSYALNDATVDAPGTALDGKRPAQVARHAASAALGWTRGRLGLSGTARFVGRQFEDDGNTRVLGSAVTLDGAARLALSKHAEVELRVENITDSMVLAGISSDGTRERASPRTLWVGLSLR
jgi:outer membrane receptor protein involved in Fe transport